MKSPMTFIRKLYAPPSPESLALCELEEAKRQYLQAQSVREYSESMVKYHDMRIKRLTAYLREAHKEKRNVQL